MRLEPRLAIVAIQAACLERKARRQTCFIWKPCFDFHRVSKRKWRIPRVVSHFRTAVAQQFSVPFSNDLYSTYTFFLCVCFFFFLLQYNEFSHRMLFANLDLLNWLKKAKNLGKHCTIFSHRVKWLLCLLSVYFQTNSIMALLTGQKRFTVISST